MGDIDEPNFVQIEFIKEADISSMNNDNWIWLESGSFLSGIKCLEAILR